MPLRPLLSAGNSNNSLEVDISRRQRRMLPLLRGIPYLLFMAIVINHFQKATKPPSKALCLLGWGRDFDRYCMGRLTRNSNYRGA